jgi:hypothetical protein
MQAVEWARRWVRHGLSRCLGTWARRWGASQVSRANQVWARQAVAWRTEAAC